jgi:hypothetical protein
MGISGAAKSVAGLRGGSYSQKKRAKRVTNTAASNGVNFDKKVSKAVADGQTQKRSPHDFYVATDALSGEYSASVARYIALVTTTWSASIKRSQIMGCRHATLKKRTRRGTTQCVPDTANVEDVCLIERGGKIGLLVVERKLKNAPYHRYMARDDVRKAERVAHIAQAKLQAECVINHVFAEPAGVPWTSPVISQILNATYCAVYITFNGKAAFTSTTPQKALAIAGPYYGLDVDCSRAPTEGSAPLLATETLVDPDSPAGKAIQLICAQPQKKKTRAAREKVPVRKSKPPKKPHAKLTTKKSNA